jgi:hypothetical protein
MSPRRIPNKYMCTDQKVDEIWVAHVSDGRLKLEQEILLVPDVMRVMMTLKIVGLVKVSKDNQGYGTTNNFTVPSSNQIRNKSTENFYNIGHKYMYCDHIFSALAAG